MNTLTHQEQQRHHFPNRAGRLPSTLPLLHFSQSKAGRGGWAQPDKRAGQGKAGGGGNSVAGGAPIAVPRARSQPKRRQQALQGCERARPSVAAAVASASAVQPGEPVAIAGRTDVAPGGGLAGGSHGWHARPHAVRCSAVAGRGARGGVRAGRHRAPGPPCPGGGPRRGAVRCAVGGLVGAADAPLGGRATHRRHGPAGVGEALTVVGNHRPSMARSRCRRSLGRGDDGRCGPSA